MLNGAGQIPNIVPAANTAPAKGAVLPKNPVHTGAPAPHATDVVTLSDRAREASRLAAAAAKIKAVPEVRPNRVQEIIAKIGKGGDAAAQNAKIAEKLLTEI